MTATLQVLMPVSGPEIAAEQRRALRALLRQPLLPATGETAEEYLLVRRHAAWLKQWLTEFPAWRLHIDKEVARLGKLPGDLIDETRPALDRSSGTPFSKRKYTLLCLALAALEDLDWQTTLCRIADLVMEFAADPDLHAGWLHFDIANYGHRRDLVQVIRFIADIGVLQKLDGDEQEFLNDSGSPGVLYEINRWILAATLNVASSPSAIATSADQFARSSLTQRVACLIDDPAAGTDDARFRKVRSRLVRALLDDPILYYHDLNAEEMAYLSQHRGYLLRQICEATGLIAEVRREGIALLDDDGGLTGVNLLEEGTGGQLSLLLLQWFSERCRTSPGALIPLPAVEEYVRNLTRLHGSQWRQELCDDGAEARLTADTLLRLRSLRLIELTEAAVAPLPACGRYAANDSSPLNECNETFEE